MTVFKREQILAALHAALPAIGGFGVGRNIPLSVIDGGGFVSLEDGTTELTEQFFNPPVYEWTMRPQLVIGIAWPDIGSPDAALVALIEEAAGIVEGLGALGGLASEVRPDAPDFDAKEVFGLVNMKGAVLPIEIDYWSDSPLG